MRTKHRGILSRHGVFGRDHSMTSLVVAVHRPFFFLSVFCLVEEDERHLGRAFYTKLYRQKSDGLD